MRSCASPSGSWAVSTVADRIPPWLTHLRVDRRGLPVPYVNQWGPDDPDRVSIRHDHHYGRPGVFFDDSAETVPDFTAQQMDRQRECIAAGLCQVCARHIPWSRRFLVLASISVRTIKLHGRHVPVITEPWLCQRCAEFATTTCPALIRRRRDEDLQLIPVTTKRQVRIGYSVGWIEGPCEAESRRVYPAIWGEIHLLYPRIAMVDREAIAADMPGELESALGALT